MNIEFSDWVRYNKSHSSHHRATKMPLPSNKRHKKIIHIDMDCFYAAVEMREHPELKARPLAVGGTSDRGVLTTCNYPARKFGLHSAMGVSKAKTLCPDLVILPVDMAKYRQVSAEIHQIFRRYTDKVEPLSLDEAFLDVTESELFQGSATFIANDIRRSIFDELQLTASAGIAPVKFLAKIASDINKPNGSYTIAPQQMDAFIKTLKLEKISGVGKVTIKKLHQLNFFTGADLQHSSEYALQQLFGKMGRMLWRYGQGIDPREINNDRLRHSLAVEKTLTTDITGIEPCLALITTLYDELLFRLQRLDLESVCVIQNQLTFYGIRTQGIKLKFSDYKSTTVEHASTQLDFETFAQLLHIALQRQGTRKIRLIGLTIGFNQQKMAEQRNKQEQQLKFDFP